MSCWNVHLSLSSYSRFFVWTSILFHRSFNIFSDRKPNPLILQHKRNEQNWNEFNGNYTECEHMRFCSIHNFFVSFGWFGIRTLCSDGFTTLITSRWAADGRPLTVGCLIAYRLIRSRNGLTKPWIRTGRKIWITMSWTFGIITQIWHSATTHSSHVISTLFCK